MTASQTALANTAPQAPETNPVKGWMTDVDLVRLSALAAKVPVGGIIVEAGALLGQSSWTLAKNCDPSVTVFSMDVWDPTFMTEQMMKEFGTTLRKDVFRENTRDCTNIIPLQGIVPQDFADWNQPVDMFFDDATHNDPPFSINQAYWGSHVRPGGIICGHDFDATYPDIVRNVEARAKEWNQTPEVHSYVWSLNKPVNAPAARYIPSACAATRLNNYTDGPLLDGKLLSCHIGSAKELRSKVVLVANPGMSLPESVLQSLQGCKNLDYAFVPPSFLEDWADAAPNQPVGLASSDPSKALPLAEALDWIILVGPLSSKAQRGLQRTLWRRLNPVLGNIYLHAAKSDTQRSTLLAMEAVHYWVGLSAADREGNAIFNLDRPLPRALCNLAVDDDLSPAQKRAYWDRFIARLPK